LAALAASNQAFRVSWVQIELRTTFRSALFRTGLAKQTLTWDEFGLIDNAATLLKRKTPIRILGILSTTTDTHIIIDTLGSVWLVE
jgi:hypothetical protein